MLLNNPKPARMQPTLNGNRQMAPVCTAHNISFLGTGRVQIQTTSRSVQQFLHRLLQAVAAIQIRTVPIMRPLKPYRSLYNENAKFRGAPNL